MCFKNLISCPTLKFGLSAKAPSSALSSAGFPKKKHKNVICSCFYYNLENRCVASSNWKSNKTLYFKSYLQTE